MTHLIITLPHITPTAVIGEGLREELEMKKRVLTQIFGKSLGILLPRSRDSRNDIGFVQQVYGIRIASFMVQHKRNSVWDDE